MTISAFPTPTPTRGQTQDVFDPAMAAFLAHFPTFVTEANLFATAMNLNETNATSVSSVLIGTGSKTFTVSAGKSFQPGMYIVAAGTAAPSTNSMYLQVVSYSGTTLVATSLAVRGSGTIASWVISQSSGGINVNGDAAQVFSVAPATAATHALQASQKPGFPVNFNGNMQIAQAGTSFAAPANGVYDIDGWLTYNTSAAVFTVAQVTGSIAGKYARQVTITTADASVAAGDILAEQTRVEGYDAAKLVGKDFTVSFRAKFPVTGIHCVALANYGAVNSYVHEINCLVANTWDEYSFTVVGGLPNSGTYTDSPGLYVSLAHGTGSTFQTSTADTWMTGNRFSTANQVNDCATIGNVWALEDFRIDLGTVKGTEWPSYQENLARCQRYVFDPLTKIGAIHSNTNNFSGSVVFPVFMRASPTLNISNLGTYNNANSAPGANQWGILEANSGNYVTYSTPPTNILIVNSSLRASQVYSVGTTPSLNTQGYEYMLILGAGSRMLFESRL